MKEDNKYPLYVYANTAPQNCQMTPGGAMSGQRLIVIEGRGSTGATRGERLSKWGSENEVLPFRSSDTIIQCSDRHFDKINLPHDVETVSHLGISSSYTSG